MDTKPIPQPTPDSKEFWEGCERGEFRFQRCRSCGACQFYPRPICVSCHQSSLDWETASGLGSIYSYTTVYRAPREAFDEDVPYLLLLVDLAEGVRVMANLPGIDEASIGIGTPVRIVFESRGGIALPQAKLIAT